MIPLHLRRGTAALAVSVVLGAVAAPAAFAAPAPSPVAIPSGLYGKGDPTYDGVFRQSLAFTAQHNAGVRPSAKAVDWLVGQQCEDGAFPAFRAEVTQDCDAKAMRDTNATATAVQALGAVGGQDAAVKKAVTWLKSVQNADGGWPYVAGSPSDANSTSLVTGALNGAGLKDDALKGKDGKTPLQALLGFQVSCDGKDENRGSFAFQPDKSGKLYPSADATAAVVTAAAGRGGPVIDVPKEKDKPVQAAPGCKEGMGDPKAAAAGGSDYLARTLDKNGGHLMTAPLPGVEAKPDFGNTADAVVALAADGHQEAARKSADWLAKNSAAWAKGAGPAAYAQLAFAAHATGMDPRDFGGADLVEQLNATGPAPEVKKDADDAEKKSDDEGGSSATWWIVGVAFVASMGAGILISGRNKKNQQL
ncbi:terpene cyclase/mutase family protein [Streptomyces sp. NBC_00237]|uniref:prenyltransferase/squalene oxidase repeat-containing protein n=1 Tax=Streptomyces sp. NBC_00237 TaxID=2975687 RepID=UPI00225ABA9B|nr:prenyltransferase/squalene oxidase repeat-containing protein [Streptomyces sp. NBC_00237]MCX5201528.1 terpene cyclase/mutase family protein [Streptomyces sp. NBC_00237]